MCGGRGEKESINRGSVTALAVVNCFIYMNKVEACRIFLDQMPYISETAQSVLSKYRAEFEEYAAHQNPQAASDYAESQLEAIEVDEPVLGVYDTVAEFMYRYNGEGAFAENVPLVEDMAELALCLSNAEVLTESAMQLTVDAVARHYPKS